jgi:hypothetical protein
MIQRRPWLAWLEPGHWQRLFGLRDADVRVTCAGKDAAQGERNSRVVWSNTWISTL